MSAKLNKVGPGKYTHASGYTVTRRKYTTPVASIVWRVECPTTRTEDCDSLAAAREFIADDISEQAAMTAEVLSRKSLRRVHRFFRR
jgi:hypothetical protein